STRDWSSDVCSSDLILINCAGYVGTTKVRGWAVPFEQQTAEAFEEAIFVNLTAAFVMAKEARSSLQQSGHGSIILFLSTYAMVEIGRASCRERVKDG